jgi:hypothetical protein
VVRQRFGRGIYEEGVRLRKRVASYVRSAMMGFIPANATWRGEAACRRSSAADRCPCLGWGRVRHQAGKKDQRTRADEVLVTFVALASPTITAGFPH